MDRTIFSLIKARSEDIRYRWEELLRVDEANSALANPDTLIFLIPKTIEQVLTRIESMNSRRLSFVGIRPLPRHTCECGRNPYLAYYTAGEQALAEALILAQSQTRRLENRQRDLAEVFFVIRQLASAELEAFCGLCMHRTKAGCRHCSHASSAAVAAAAFA